jgi:hypothetical protein
VAQRGFGQFLAVLVIVDVVGEAGLAVVAALYDVLRDTGQVEARKAWGQV